MKENNQRKIGVILSYVSIIVSTLVQLIYTPLLIRYLGESEYGLYSLVASIIGYLTVLDLGFGNAIIVYTSKYKTSGEIEKEQKLHGMFKMIFIIIAIIVSVLGLILYFNVENIFSNSMTDLEIKKMKVMMLILTFNLAISFSFSIYSSIITAYEKFTFLKITSIINSIIKPVIMIPLLFVGCKSITLCVVITIVNLVILILNYIYCKNKLNIKIKYLGFDKSLFKIIFSYSVWIFLGVIVDKVNWSVDQFILGAVCGTAAVSIYSISSQINSMFINLSTALSGVLLPKISKMVASKASNEEITNEFIKVGRIQYLIIFLMASGLTLFGKEFFVAWVGNDYIDSYYISLILILPLCISLIQNLGVSIMQAKNMHKFRSILYAVIAVLNIIISIPLAKKYAGIGSAIGTALSLIIGNGFIINYYYHKKVGINVIKFWGEILKMTIPNIISVVLIIIFMHFIVLHGYASVIVYGSIYTLIYCIVCYHIIMNSYEKEIVSSIFKKLKLKRG